MVNRDLLATKLADLQDRVQRVRNHTPPNATDFVANRDALDLVAFNLMLAVQICSDICTHLIADEGWPAATTLAQGFARLEQYQVIDAQTAERLKRAVGLRNVIAHGYSGIDIQVCHQAATAGVGDIETFARLVSAWALGPR